MIPSLGRIVLFHNSNDIDGYFDSPALVTNVARVGGILVCCLTVFDHHGGVSGRMAVKEGIGLGEWSWPPRV